MPSALEARTRIVQSPANRWVKALRAALLRPPALAQGKAGGEQPLVALEGFHLVEAALAAGLVPAALFLRAGEERQVLETLARLGACSTYEAAGLPDATEILALPPELFASLLLTEAPQPVAALVAAPVFSHDAVFRGDAPLIVVLAGLQDPGNVGTLLRSAEAFGASGALLLGGTASPWNPKCLRASAGTVLRLPMLAVRDAEESSTLLSARAIRSYAAVPGGGERPESLPLDRPAALWIGNEGAGLGTRELAACEARITIHMPGASESLNAAVAGSLLLYEAARQRAGRLYPSGRA